MTVSDVIYGIGLILAVMFKRDQITFNPQNESDDEDDILDGHGEEVLGLNLSDNEDEEGGEEEEFDEEAEQPLPKERKVKAKEDVSTKGRFGKSEVSSDEEVDSDTASGSGSGSEEEEEEGWGRQYYSRPSTARAREKEGVTDEKREEEREMEEREVKRLQKKAREAIGGAEDWGLQALDAVDEVV
jgi:U3 small nucleolar RNA-associated protein 3